MTDLQSKLARLKELVEKATPGERDWFGNAKTNRMWLATKRGGRQIIMDFVRWGMTNAGPRFNVGGIMRRCDELGVTDHNGDFTVEHPDAKFIAACDPDTVRELLQAAERGMEYEKALKEIAQGCWYHASKEQCRSAAKFFPEIASKALASDPPQGKEDGS